MPERLPRELRVLYELARVVAVGPYSLDEVLERICKEVKTEFGFTSVRLVRSGDDPLIDHALVMRRAVTEGGRDRKSTRLNSSHTMTSRMPSSA